MNWILEVRKQVHSYRDTEVEVVQQDKEQKLIGGNRFSQKF